GPTQPQKNKGQANQNKTNPKNHTQPKSCAAPRAMA
ncbi:cell envelope biogenesis protein TolA, partial [Actinomyces oris]